MSVPVNVVHGGVVGTALHVGAPPPDDATHCVTHTPPAQPHDAALFPSTATTPVNSFLTRGPTLLESKIAPHVPRFCRAAATRAPSRAAFVIIWSAKKTQPNSMMPRTTTIRSEMTMPVSIKAWPR